MEFIEQTARKDRHGILELVSDRYDQEVLSELGMESYTDYISLNEIASRGWELAFAYPLNVFDGDSYRTTSNPLSVFIFKKPVE